MRTLVRLCLILLAVAAPTASQAARAYYYKMVDTNDAAGFHAGKILKPRFAKRLLKEDHPVTMGRTTSYNGGAAERLFQETLTTLRKEGKVDRQAPGRTEGIFVAADLNRFPQFRDDPYRSKVTLAPVSKARVATYDRRHFLAAIRALDRADKATGAAKTRHLATAQREAERYYLVAPNLADAKAEPETLLGGGGTVVKVTLRR